MDKDFRKFLKHASKVVAEMPQWKRGNLAASMRQFHLPAPIYDEWQESVIATTYDESELAEAGKE